MARYTQNEIEEYYRKLPEVLRDALFSPSVAENIFAVGKKFGLTIEKIGFLAEQVGFIVLGLSRPPVFTRVLAESLGMDNDKAREIAKEINSQIFYPLREALKAAHQIEITEPATNDQRPTTETEPIAATMAKFMPLSKVEVPSMPRPIPPPAFARPPGQERKVVPPQISVVPPQAPIPRPVETPKHITPQAVTPPSPPKPAITPALPKAPTPIKPAEPIKPPAPTKPPATQPKIQPIDLRKATPPAPKAPAGKPERMREAIFAPPVEPQTTVPAEPKKESPPYSPKAIESGAKPPEKKTPYGGYDPYKEPMD